MHTWASLTPAQRQAAREQYKNFKKLPPEQRQNAQAKWQEYQQLSPEQKRELASRTPATATQPQGR
jgi:hypothetical protein